METVAQFFCFVFAMKLKQRFEWLLRAANNALIEAQIKVALCFEKGREAGHNDGKVYKYYKCAAEQGSELVKRV